MQHIKKERASERPKKSIQKPAAQGPHGPHVSDTGNELLQSEWMNDWLSNVVLFDVQFAEPREANCEDVMRRRFD